MLIDRAFESPLTTNRLRSFRSLLGLACTLPLWGGCAADANPGAVRTAADEELLHCSGFGPGSSGANSGSQVFGLARMNRKLAQDTQLRQRSGLQVVTTCEQAQRFVQAVEDQHTERELEALTASNARFERQADAQLVDKVFGSKHVGRRGSVGIMVDPSGNFQICTAQLVSAHTMISAAHCFGASGVREVLLNYLAPSGTQYEYIDTLAVTVHPDYVEGFPENDIAVMVAVNGWQLPGDFVALRTHTPVVGESFYVNGYGGPDLFAPGEPAGPTALPLQFVSDDTLYFADLAPSYGRMCDGDSGSMAIIAYKLTSNISEGVDNSGFSTTGHDVCTSTGYMQRWTAIPPKEAWIESIVYAAGDSCVFGSDQGYKHRRCH